MTQHSGPVLIAAHHYQLPEIVRRADLVGDSYRLAVSASRSDAESIVMCGVKFMAESIAILARDTQSVYLPAQTAGCPMADMITGTEAADALAALEQKTGERIFPISYMNTSAEVKAITGKAGGSICTSSNAGIILSTWLDAGKRVFFIPDRNLGLNTAQMLGLSPEHIALVHRDYVITGLDRNNALKDITHIKLFLWDGFCPVHRSFSVADVQKARVEHPGAQIIVHPECEPDVVLLSDSSGSTDTILSAISTSKPGSIWVVGTEYRFIQRMVSQFPDKTILPLKVSLCRDMGLTDEAALNTLLAALSENSPHRPEPILIEESIRSEAKKALNRMVEITERVTNS